MSEIIEAIILEFNLSPLEDYYLDKENRLRARGFIYDEDTGIFMNEYGLFELESPRIEENKELVREIFDIRVEVPLLHLSMGKVTSFEPVVKEESVAVA